VYGDDLLAIEPLRVASVFEFVGMQDDHHRQRQ
jgi:hypothetical protein